MNDWQKSVVLDYETVAVTNMRDRDAGLTARLLFRDDGLIHTCLQSSTPTLTIRPTRCSVTSCGRAMGRMGRL